MAAACDVSGQRGGSQLEWVWSCFSLDRWASELRSALSCGPLSPLLQCALRVCGSVRAAASVLVVAAVAVPLGCADLLL